MINHDDEFFYQAYESHREKYRTTKFWDCRNTSGSDHEYTMKM